MQHTMTHKALVAMVAMAFGAIVNIAVFLTPLAVDPAHPFPYISGLSLNLAVLVRNPKTGKEHFARVKVPPIFSRFVPVGPQRFVPLEDVIAERVAEQRLHVPLTSERLVDPGPPVVGPVRAERRRGAGQRGVLVRDVRRVLDLSPPE